MKARIPGAPQGGNIMKKIQEAKENMAAVQKEIEETEFSASVGGGAAEVVVNGAHEAKSIKLDPEIVDPEDVEALEDLLISAFNESVKKADEAMARAMERVGGELSVPGLF